MVIYGGESQNSRSAMSNEVWILDLNEAKWILLAPTTTEKPVPVVLNRIVCSPWEQLGNLGPFVTYF